MDSPPGFEVVNCPQQQNCENLPEGVNEHTIACTYMYIHTQCFPRQSLICKDQSIQKPHQRNERRAQHPLPWENTDRSSLFPPYESFAPTNCACFIHHKYICICHPVYSQVNNYACFFSTAYDCGVYALMFTERVCRVKLRKEPDSLLSSVTSASVTQFRTDTIALIHSLAT